MRVSGCLLFQFMSPTKESANFYTLLQRRLHWLVIILLIMQYALQEPMSEAMARVGRQENLSFLDFLVTTWHTWSGICIAAIMIWRWQLRGRHVPPGAGKLSPMQSKLIQLHHMGLYLVVGVMALSGALHYYLDVALAGVWHEFTKWLLLGLIGVHIAGALTHIGNGDRVFQRMMGKDSLR